MTWLVASAWVLSGIACWGRFDRWCAREDRCQDPLARDISHLIMMLTGPVVFLLYLASPEEKA